MTNTPPATIHLGDCIEVMRTLPENSVDAIVTDPPYGLGFMGKAWDELPPGEEWARECLRVLKPGGHLLAFGGSRTWHRLAVAVEDAGFEVRDSIAWLYGSGFPKSLDVSKAIDKARDDKADVLAIAAWLSERRAEAGITIADINRAMALDQMARWWFSERLDLCQCPTWEQWQQLRDILRFGDEMDAEVWRLNGRKGTPGDAWDQREVIGTKQAGMGSGKTFGMLQAEGHNGDASHDIDITAPATDDARKWAGFGTALKPAFEPIVVARKPLAGTVAANVLTHGTGALNIDGCRVGTEVTQVNNYSGHNVGITNLDGQSQAGKVYTSKQVAGRWPANVVLDESQASALDEMSGVSKSPSGPVKQGGTKGTRKWFEPGTEPRGTEGVGYGDTGGASRFFYVAKAPTRERPKVDGVAHPTVKPLALMRWLVRLVTPPGGTVLEPFAGSGTTVEACALEGFACIAIEREPDYLPLIQARLARVEAEQPEPVGPSLFDMEETA